MSNLTPSKGLIFISNGNDARLDYGTCRVKCLGTCADQNVVIPAVSPKGDRVTSIGDSAFSVCQSLVNVIIPDGVMSVGTWSFSYCERLVSVTIPASIKSIGDGAFLKCTSLSDIYYQGTESQWKAVVKGKGWDDGLPFYTVHYTKASAADSSSGAKTASASVQKTVSASEGLRFFSNGNGTCRVSGIGICTDTDVVIPAVSPAGDRVTSIGYEAFRHCTNLANVTIPNSVAVIDKYAFSNCKSLVSVTIPDSVKSIGTNAFYYCTSLASVTISDSVMSIGDWVFRDCARLADIYYGGTEAQWQSVVKGEGWDEGLPPHTVHYARTAVSVGLRFSPNRDGTCRVKDLGTCADTEVVIPTVSPKGDRITSIDDWAFEDCESLVSVTIPDSVTSIGECAFSDCTSLADIYYEGTEAQWQSVAKGEGWDEGLPLYTVHYARAAVSVGLRFSPHRDGTCRVKDLGTCADTEVVIPTVSPKGDRVTSIGDWAFEDCKNLTRVTIPASVKRMGEFAFSDCKSLSDIYYEGTEAQWRSVVKGEGWDSGIPSYTVHYAKTSVADSASEGLDFFSKGDGTCRVSGIGSCTDTEVVIPAESPEGDRVTNIGPEAFSGVANLVRVVIPDGVTSIGNWAFLDCSSLVSMTVPVSVKSIGNQAFVRCVDLKNIDYKGTEAQWNAIGKGESWRLGAGAFTVRYGRS